MSVLNLEAEIDDLQCEIEHYKDLVLDKHREALTWETKYKLIEETLRWQKEERSNNSELTTMKNEIHRMQIRHQQLKRAQEKLALDLEHCVMHREQIFESANVKQKVEFKAQKRSKGPTNAQQKLVDLRTKLKQMQQEISHLSDEQLVNATQEHERIYDDIKKVRAEIDRETTENDEIRAQIDDCMLQKHLNLEAIVRKQNRAKSYRSLTISPISAKLHRSETTLNQQHQKQSDMNDSLVDIVQSLMTEIPEKQTFFSKILQILRD